MAIYYFDGTSSDSYTNGGWNNTTSGYQFSVTSTLDGTAQGIATRFTVPSGQRWTISNAAFYSGLTPGNSPSNISTGTVYVNLFDSNGTYIAPSTNVVATLVPSPSSFTFGFSYLLTSGTYYIGLRKPLSLAATFTLWVTKNYNNAYYIADNTGDNTVKDSIISGSFNGGLGGLVGNLTYTPDYPTTSISTFSATPNGRDVTFNYTVGNTEYAKRVDLYNSTNNTLIQSGLTNGQTLTIGYGTSTTYTLRVYNYDPAGTVYTTYTTQTVTTPAAPSITPGTISTVTVVDSTNIDITYSAGSATNYTVTTTLQWSTNQTTWNAVSGSAITSGSKTQRHSGLTPKTTYYYRLYQTMGDATYDVTSASTIGYTTLGGRIFYYNNGWVAIQPRSWDASLVEKDMDLYYRDTGNTSWIISPY